MEGWEGEYTETLGVEVLRRAAGEGSSQNGSPQSSKINYGRNSMNSQVKDA